MPFYFINFDDAPVEDIEYNANNTDVMEKLNRKSSTISAIKYDIKRYVFSRTTITSSRDNGTTFFEQAFKLVLKKQDLVTTRS